MVSRILFSSQCDEYSTPNWLFDRLNYSFFFTLDPAASALNHKCKKFYTKEDDGLKQSWKGEVVFVNPPYSQIEAWMKKCHDEYVAHRCLIVALIPSRTDTRYFHNYCQSATGFAFIKGRLKFEPAKSSAPFPSMLVMWNRDWTGLRRISFIEK